MNRLLQCFCISVQDDKEKDEQKKEIDININMFEDYTAENTPWLSLEGLVCQCKVVSVYDADTVTIIIPWNNSMYKVKCRLVGIDSAEKRTKNKEEKAVALKATEWLKSVIDGKIIWIKCGKWGKYGGRMLGVLYLSEEDLKSDKSVNNSIVEKGYAYKYDGKKKRKFADWYKIM